MFFECLDVDFLYEVLFFFFFKQKTAYEIVSGDWSSDVCSSDLLTYEYIGKRFQDESNLTPLPSYWDLGAGIDARVGESWEFRLLGSNLTNEIGLTEGNARFGGNTVQNNVGMGRSIVGREVNLTAKYVW